MGGKYAFRISSGAAREVRNFPARSGPRVCTRPLTTDSGRSATTSYAGFSFPSFALKKSHCAFPGAFSDSRRCPATRVRTRCQAPRSFLPLNSTWMRPFLRCSESWPGGIESAVPLSQMSESPAPYSPSGMRPSKLPYSMGWSSVCTASRLTAGS